MMTADNYFHLEPIGAIHIRKNSRSRRIRLRVKPDGKVQVSMPLLVSEQKAIDFVKSKVDWILRQQQDIKAGLTIFSPDKCFKTKFHELKIVPVDQNKVSAMVGKGIIQINIPSTRNHQQPEIQQFIRKVIIQVMRQEAKVYLPSRLKELAQHHQLSVQNVYVKHVKSRWGSCSSVNNINLNLHLMRLPNHLADYVILHELAHTVEKNHGPGFWQLLEQICPGSKKLDKELNQYHVDTY
ncbi:M48 family metallopeptidase [Mangrovibacterium lignilyticum]|uniref:M48 family metallopeptidase n=1 Tax=Mangrovibacterium lignilyticum TaxID=2668052 RepID=UPI0019680E6A|nr:SprT family zinc-dependent metalloprotease [Mangrovibacterium lignilyticum]